MRLIIAGSRDITDAAFIFSELDRITADKVVDEVVCGGARGPDTIGALWARKHNIPVALMEAEWDRYGRHAGRLRNKQMAHHATHLVAFWDGQSWGTKHMIDTAKDLGLEVRIIRTNVRSTQ